MTLNFLGADPTSGDLVAFRHLGTALIREERDPSFWRGIASHPAVSIMGLNGDELAPVALNPNVLPLAAEHGGFFFTRLDALGFVRELHTLFTPEGWGREVAMAGKEALSIVFATPCRLIVTYEMRSNPRSRPPRSFGFVQAGGWQDSIVGDARLWTLSLDAWRASPAFRRMH